MTTSHSNPSACQHHLTKAINLPQPIPLLCFPSLRVLDSAFETPENPSEETYEGCHRRMSFTQVFDHKSVLLSPTLSGVVKTTRDKIVRRLSWPQAHALEQSYPGVWDDKTFSPNSLAAHWQPETKEQPQRNIKSLNECQLISQDGVELIRI